VEVRGDIMIAYIYIKKSQMIIAKIDNIEYINDKDNEIRGDSTIKYGDSQDYIILQNDTTNKNVEDTIILEGLEDCRDYFLKGKDIWYQEQIKKSSETISTQNDTIENLDSLLKTTNETVQGFMDFYFQENPSQA
jgi:vacuolar-type H+-ATPase subunit I/STV1